MRVRQIRQTVKQQTVTKINQWTNKSTTLESKRHTYGRLTTEIQSHRTQLRSQHIAKPNTFTNNTALTRQNSKSLRPVKSS